MFGSTTSEVLGFGPFQDQVAYFTNVTATAANGALLYANDLRSTDVLAEYEVGANRYSFCSDGAKRDRLVWIGIDFVHAMRAIAASTWRPRTIDAAFAWQSNQTGLFSVVAPMGADPKYKDFYPFSFEVTDWQLYFLVQLGQYYQMSGETSIFKQY